MKKIKLFLITLLCMVGVMNVNAVDAVDVINSNPNNNLGGHWQWIQEEPTKGHYYKMVNGVTSATVFGAAGLDTKKATTTNIIDAGEWLYGDDGTLTIQSGDNHQIKPIYDGVITDEGTSWTIVSRPYNNSVDGYGIYLNGTVNEYYLYVDGANIKYETFFKASTIWGGKRPTGAKYVWNFYSLDQFDCYQDYKSAYEAFISIESDNSEFLALKSEVNNFVAKGNNSDNREHAYEMIERMLDMIASLGQSHGSGALENPGAEEKKQYWRFRSSASSVRKESWSTATEKTTNSPTHSGNRFFDLRNTTMSQTVSGLAKDGIYKVSVWWKADGDSSRDASTIVLSAKSSAEERTATLVGKYDGSDESTQGWSQAEIEVVVVDGRVTISATANTPVNEQSWVNLDDFELVWDRFYDIDTQSVSNTTLYRGVFSEGNNIAVVTKTLPYADITVAYGAYFKLNNTQNPNGLCYAKAGKVVKQYNPDAESNVDAVNVVREGVCTNLVLKNGFPYSTKQEFTANDAKYDMTAFGTGKDENGEQITFGTLMLPYNVASIPSGVEVYSANAISDAGVLTLSKVNSVVANTPYLVKYTGGATPKFEAYSSNQDMAVETAEDTKTSGSGLLVGAYKLTEVPSDGTNYLLQLQNGVLGFYRVSQSGLNVGPFRCYLHIPASSSAPSKISFAFEDDTTGIANVENVGCADVIYDLQGRRVENISRPGIYVKNGKKFLVK